MFIIFQWDIGSGKNKYARLQADMENNNILLSVNNACLWVLYFYIIFWISLSLSKIILLFFLTLCLYSCLWAHSFWPPAWIGLSIHVCVWACLCVLKILTSWGQYITSSNHNGCHFNMCFKLQDLSVKVYVLKPDIHSSVNKKNKTNHFVSVRSYLKNWLCFLDGSFVSDHS